MKKCGICITKNVAAGLFAEIIFEPHKNLAKIRQTKLSQHHTIEVAVKHCKKLHVCWKHIVKLE